MRGTPTPRPTPSPTPRAICFDDSPFASEAATEGTEVADAETGEDVETGAGVLVELADAAKVEDTATDEAEVAADVFDE